MGKSLREATDERLGEGAYERLLTEAIEENRYSFSPTIGWEERRSFARNMLFELCRADGVPDVPAIAEDAIVDSYCAPEGPLDLACNEAARTLCDKLKAAGIEEDFDEPWWPDAVFDVRDHDLVYSKGYFDLGEIYDALVPAEIKVDLCLGDYSHADDPTGRFSTLLAEGNLAGAAAWAHDPDNRADMAHNPIVMLLASQGHTVQGVRGRACRVLVRRGVRHRPGRRSTGRLRALQPGGRLRRPPWHRFGQALGDVSFRDACHGALRGCRGGGQRVLHRGRVASAARQAAAGGPATRIQNPARHV